LRDRHVQRARRTVEETPEVREERVAAAKRALQAGTLKLRGEELVEKLLCDPLHHPDLGVEP
jgi:anti-sigma28 factor (negative regulator of flagellin synthesis)